MKHKSGIIAGIISTGSILLYGFVFLKIELGAVLKPDFLSRLTVQPSVRLSGWGLISAAGLAGNLPLLSGTVRIVMFILWLAMSCCVCLAITVTVANLLFGDNAGNITTVAGMINFLLFTGLFGIFCYKALSLVFPLAVVTAALIVVIPIAETCISGNKYRYGISIAGIVLSILEVFICAAGIMAVYPSMVLAAVYVLLWVSGICVLVREILYLVKKQKHSHWFGIISFTVPAVFFIMSCICLLPGVPTLGMGWLGVLICDLAVVCVGMAKNPEVCWSASNAAGQIMGITGSYQGAVIDIPAGGRLAIGSDPDQVQLIIEGKNISPKHLEITYCLKNNRYEITNFSENGTFFQSGKKIPANRITKLTRDTIIYIGDQTNQFRLI